MKKNFFFLTDSAIGTEHIGVVFVHVLSMTRKELK